MPVQLRLVPAPDEGDPAAVEDEALVRRLLEGQAQAAALVWRKYSVLVRGMAIRTLGPRAEIEDVVQDVFTCLFRRVSTLRDPSALRSFLIGITLREIRAELRRRHVRRWLHLTDTGELPEPAVQSGPHPHDNEAFERLHRALDTLEPRARLAFVLRHIEGYELAEISSALECSLATTKRVLDHAQDKVAVLARRDPVLAPYVGPLSGDV